MIVPLGAPVLLKSLLFKLPSDEILNFDADDIRSVSVHGLHVTEDRRMLILYRLNGRVRWEIFGAVCLCEEWQPC